MATLPQLIVEDVRRLDDLLQEFLKQTDATVALVIDKGGFLLTHQGNADGLDLTTIGALASGAFMASQTLAGIVRDKDFNHTFQQGETTSLFTVNVDEHCLLVVVFPSNVGVGVVKYYFRRRRARHCAATGGGARTRPGGRSRSFRVERRRAAGTFPQESGVKTKNGTKGHMSQETTSELDRLLTMMIESAENISDLLFIAGKPPQVEVDGVLEPLDLEWPESKLTGDRIESLARAIIANNPKLLRDLAERGSCDCSYALERLCRFRVNIYRQNGTFAMVLRRLPSAVPTLESLGLPPVFREIVKEKNGLVFITGGAGNGKTTTLAALLHEINRTSKIHVVSLEDPIEFLHPQLKSTFSQRELGRDFYNFPDGLRAALRQAPKVILVGEIRDRETMEIALTAGETGHLVFTTLHTISADQTIHRIIGFFAKHEEQQIRERLVGSLRWIVGQRLVPKKNGGRLLMTELMGSSLRTREAIEVGENENRRLHDIIEAASSSGWHSFEQALLRAFEEDLITEETAMLYSVNKPTMRQRLDLVRAHGQRPVNHAPSVRMMVVAAAAPEPAPIPMIPEPVVKPEPRPGMLKGILNGLI